MTVQTIQATAKRYKLMQALGVIVILLSVVSCTAGAPIGAAIGWVVGLVLYVLGRLLAWWNHA